MKRLVSLVFISLFFFSSCVGQKQRQTEPTQKNVQRTFTLPEVPIMLTTPEARAEYVCEHYWDHFDFADTTYIHLPDITEQAIVNFMDLMPRVPKDLAQRSMSILYQKAAPHSPMLWHFWETMSRYWKDTSSPVRNEEMYILLCRSVESVSEVEEVLKQRAAYNREIAEKNRVGMMATDFIYTLASGKKAKLSDIRSPFTIMLFFSPDCQTCNRTKQEMEASLLLKELIANKQVAVLTVYPEEDMDLWYTYQKGMPSSWINAYDKEQTLTLKTLYDLSALPSFYLLDKDKRVLLKDVMWEDVLYYLENTPGM